MKKKLKKKYVYIYILISGFEHHSMSKLISNRINIVHGTVSWSLKELKQTIMRTIAPITYMAQASLFTHIPLVRYGALAAYLLYAYQ